VEPELLHVEVRTDFRLELFLRNSGIIAGIIVCANVLPLPRASDGFATDGRQIMDLLRGGV
jgi:hypothetical protein